MLVEELNVIVVESILALRLPDALVEQLLVDVLGEVLSHVLSLPLHFLKLVLILRDHRL